MAIDETVAEFINSAVSIGAKTYGKTLDFSDESIKYVDEILDGYHDRYLHPEKDNGMIKERINTYAHIFGVYVGEVLRRNHASDYTWQNTKFGIALAKSESTLVSPIAKASKQIAGGKESGDDILSFFNIAILIMQGKMDLKNRSKD